MEGFFFQSKSLDPYENLAIEECLLYQQYPVLYLWQNDKTVVIGKNQNAFVECDLSYAQKHSIKIARRITGGGAVYHDLGNLNFSFILPRKSYDIQRSTGIILRALNVLGIATDIDGRNDICIRDRKISGNAYFSNSVVGLHHGTLLYSVNFDTLEKVLSVSAGKKARHGISSISTRVSNIKNLFPDISLEEIVNAIKEEFFVEYDVTQLLPLPRLEIDTLLKKHSSYDWIYRRVSNYDIIENSVFTWGEVSISLQCDCENIEAIDIITDSMDTDLIDELRAFFNRELINTPDLTMFLQKLGSQSTQIASDICMLLTNCIRKYFNV